MCRRRNEYVSQLAGCNVSQLAIRSPLSHSHYIINRVFVEGAKCTLNQCEYLVVFSSKVVVIKYLVQKYVIWDTSIIFYTFYKLQLYTFYGKLCIATFTVLHIFSSSANHEPMCGSQNVPQFRQWVGSSQKKNPKKSRAVKL